MAKKTSSTIEKIVFSDYAVALPPGHGHLRPHLKKFAAEHPQYYRNVFLMMPFESSRHNQAVARAIKEALQTYGLVGLRADDKEYAQTLWENVCTYALGCKYGIAVFEKTAREAFNPNVAIELGFALSRNKQILLLKDKRIPSLPSDIVGRLYKSFDPKRLGKSIGHQVTAWAKNHGLKKQEFIPPILLSLTPIEEKVLRMRYGIGEKRKYRFDEIAAEMGLSMREVVNFQRKALTRLGEPNRLMYLLNEMGSRSSG